MHYPEIRRGGHRVHVTLDERTCLSYWPPCHSSADIWVRVGGIHSRAWEYGCVWKALAYSVQSQDRARSGEEGEEGITELGQLIPAAGRETPSDT